jgi:hypothetical protein
MITEQEKQLLLKDLCSRLPYGTMVSVDNGKYREDMKLRPYHIAAFNNWDVKPYLRPLASMTESEQKELGILFGGISDKEYMYKPYTDILYSDFGNVVDWLNAHHFDYRGLIEKGLALEAPEGMYNI